MKLPAPCAYCLMAAVIGIYTFFLSLALPTLGRDEIRIVVGWITFFLALAGACICFCFAWWQNASKHRLSIALRDVYLATGLLALTTCLMGLGGIMSFSHVGWDFAYNFRAIPLIIEVCMMARLFFVMRDTGKGK